MCFFGGPVGCYVPGWGAAAIIRQTYVFSGAVDLAGGCMFRMLRLAKLTRMGRLGRSFPELVTMIKGLVKA